jgi:hypothetical protein
MERPPSEELAAATLPPPLLAAIRAAFQGTPPGIAQVDGTALAGFYAGHRSSDDMDLFTADATSQAMAVAAIKGLVALGAGITDERTNPFFYHALLDLNDHKFTAQAVVDTNIHRIGTFPVTPGGIRVASVDTLRKMKIATLVSRCSEKDLYDLVWLKAVAPWPTAPELVALGREVDRGFDAESVLISLAAADLKLASCGFAAGHGVPAKDVLARIKAFHQEMQASVMDYLEAGGAPAPAIGALIRRLRRRR